MGSLFLSVLTLKTLCALRLHCSFDTPCCTSTQNERAASRRFDSAVDVVVVVFVAAFIDGFVITAVAVVAISDVIVINGLLSNLYYVST